MRKRIKVGNKKRRRNVKDTGKKEKKEVEKKRIKKKCV